MANNTIGEKEIKTDFPHQTGLELIDKHEGRVINLVPTDKSLVSERVKRGLDGRKG